MSSRDQSSQHIAAYKVSTTRRVAQIVFTTFACSLASGIVFGFAALKPVLIAEGIYRDLCPPGYNNTSAALNVPCAEQDKRLNLFFISSSIAANASTFLAGVVLDRFGRRTCYMASSLFLATGSVVMGCAFTLPQFDGYILGNLFLGLGGTLLFVSSFQLADAFPKYSGTVVALVTGAFDASAAVFLFYRISYEASNGILTPARFFFGYLIIPALMVVAEFTFMPPHAYHDTTELEQKIDKANDRMLDVHDSDDGISDDGELRRVRSIRAQRRADKLGQIEGLLGNSEERQERHDLVERHQAISGVWGVLHDVPFSTQILSPWFILLLLLTVVQMLRMNYFIATIREQYLYMLRSEGDARAINNLFDVALPTTGIILTPFIGLVLNNFSIATILSALTLFIALIGAVNCIPSLWAGYMTVIAFVIFRPLYYSVLSDYTTKVFGFATFGRIYGAFMCISGLANFVLPGLDALTHGPLNGDPLPVNLCIAIAGTLLGIAITIFVAIRCRVVRNNQPTAGIENERTRLIIREGPRVG